MDQDTKPTHCGLRGSSLYLGEGGGGRCSVHVGVGTVGLASGALPCAPLAPHS